jgi:thiol peroxidase
MATITHKGNKISTVGTLPPNGATAKDFTLVKVDLSEATLASFAGKKKIVNIYPSVDTGICAMSVKAFHQKLAQKSDVVVLNVSCDLPFAFKRFCGAEGIENAVGLSAFRSDFPDTWGVRITDGLLKGLCSRAVVVLSADDKVLYTEQVPEIAQEPAYDKAIAALG